MKTIKCEHCKREMRWSGGRGKRPSDTPCPFCGEKLATRPHPRPSLGKRYGNCPVCGLRRLENRPCWWHSKEAIAAAIAAKQREGGAA